MRLIKQCHPSSPDRRKMDILPDEILLRIFTFLPFVMRITLRLVSWRWRKVLFDHSLLQRVKINGRNCEDHQLETLMSAAKRVVEVDFFNCVNLTGSCLMSTELSRLRHLTLTGTAINNGILERILDSCKDELIELNLAGTRIRLSECLPKIVELKQLKYFSAPPREITASGTRAVVEIAERYQTLRTLDCQEGYFFDGEDVSRIVHANPRLTSLLIPFSFVNDDTVMSIVENLSNLRYLCICETDVTQDCVQRIKSSKANLELCCDA